MSIPEKYEDFPPRVIAKGKGEIAQKIMQIAKDNNIDVVREPYLVRQLYPMVKIGDFIPEEFMFAIAEIMKTISKVQEKLLRLYPERFVAEAI